MTISNQTWTNIAGILRKELADEYCDTAIQFLATDEEIYRQKAYCLEILYSALPFSIPAWETDALAWISDYIRFEYVKKVLEDYNPQLESGIEEPFSEFVMKFYTDMMARIHTLTNGVEESTTVEGVPAVLANEIIANDALLHEREEGGEARER